MSAFGGTGIFATSLSAIFSYLGGGEGYESSLNEKKNAR